MRCALMLSVALRMTALLSANSCPAPTPNPSEEFARSDFVFSGEIFDVRLNVRSGTAKQEFDLFRVRVEEVWKGDPGAIADLWEEASGYDVRFAKGQTTLVYATRDSAGRLTQGYCGRGGMLNQSGDDLAYLYFVKHRPDRSARIFGFVTTDEADLKARPRVWTDPPHPAKLAMLELSGRDGKFYTMTSTTGQFAFDGLAGGEYSLAVMGEDFPLKKRVVKKGIKIRVAPRGFARQEVFVPKALLEQNEDR